MRICVLAIHTVNSPAVAAEVTVSLQPSRLLRQLCESPAATVDQDKLAAVIAAIRGCRCDGNAAECGVRMSGYDGVQATLVLAGWDLEGFQADRDGGEMRAWLATPVALGSPSACAARCRRGRRC